MLNLFKKKKTQQEEPPVPQVWRDNDADKWADI